MAAIAEADAQIEDAEVVEHLSRNVPDEIRQEKIEDDAREAYEADRELNDPDAEEDPDSEE